MDASLIWYRARSDGQLSARINELLEALDSGIKEENTTINPAIVPALLAEALKNSDIVVIIGGMDIRREEENIITILSHCLALHLEEDEQSRSSYIYDTLRGKVLPTFDSAMLFPSANGGPEGVMLTAGSKMILLLPWMERQHMDIITMMCSYLPGIVGLSESVPEPEPEISSDDISEKPALPDYIERATAKHRAAAVSPNEELSAAQLKVRLSRDIHYTEPKETNRHHLSSGTVPPARLAQRTPQAAASPAEINTNRAGSRRGLPMQIMLILLMLAVIGVSCYIAIFHYESGLLSSKELYQSELAALYTDDGDSSILPQFALPQFAQLYEKNADIRGFISIPGTDIALPVMQSAEGGVDKYEELDFYGNADDRGTLYFDAANDLGFGAVNSNLVVYGSSPVDGSMFAQLKNYTNADFLARHSVISMDTLYEQSKWLVFSVCIVSQNTVSDFNYANTVFAGQNAHELHLHNLYVRSLFFTETEVFPTDSLLTLVADSDEFSGAKLLVCARKLRADEDEPSRKISVTANEQVLMPDIWYQLNGSQSPSVPGLEFDPSTTRDTITAPIITDENGDRVYVYESLAVTTTTTTAGSGDNGSSTSAQTTSTTLAAASTLPDMRITSGGKVITGSAVEILAMIVEAEMGSDCEPEALKAQAVAAYTFYLYSGGSAKAPSFPTKTAGERAREAAQAVAGIYMTYKGSVPFTPYFAISAGRTADNSDINGAELAYLVSVESSIDETVSGYCTVKEMTAAEVAGKVLEKKSIDLTTISDKSQWFQILERDANGLYVTRVSVGGQEFKGNTLHLSILGYACLNSPCFTIEYVPDSDRFIFTSYGYGSGVGMSQSAANEYAHQGYDYAWILKHFYSGIELTNS